MHGANWEQQLLTEALSLRARRTGFAYAGPGSGNDLSLDAEPPIAFTGGIPDPALLPIDALAAAAETVLRREGADALTYGGAQGYHGLREWLAGHWSPIESMSLGADSYSITNGSAHALDNVLQTFVDAGDLVLVEAPSFPGSLRAIRSMGAEMDSIPVDADGLDVDALEAKLDAHARNGRPAKLLYTIPNYHNPTGTTLTLERRHRLLGLCERHNVPVIEDDAYGEIGYDDPLPPSLFSIAGGRGVIRLGTFSKTIAAGLRVGWLQATPPIVGATLATRFDMGLSPFLLRTVTEFATNGRFEAHTTTLRTAYGRKRDLMVNELAERASTLVDWTQPGGGFFVWLHLADSIDADLLRATAEEEGVAFGRGAGFFADPPGEGPFDTTRYIRLALSYEPEDRIVEGVRRLSRALQRASR